MSRLLLCFNMVLGVLLAMPNPVIAQNTDVGEKIDVTLKNYGPVPVTRIEMIPRTVHRCHGGSRTDETCVDSTVYDQVAKTGQEILTPANIRIVKSGPLEFGELVKSELPDKVLISGARVVNCTNNTVNQTLTLSQAFQRSVSIGITHSITKTNGGQIGVQYKLNQDLTVSGQISVSTAETNSTVDTKGSNMTVTKSQTGSTPVPGHTSIIGEIRVWPVRYSVPFKAQVVVDADLSKNDRSLTSLSQIADEQSRTYDITGTIDGDDATDGLLVFNDSDMDEKLCNGNKKLIVQNPYRVESGTKLMERR